MKRIIVAGPRDYNNVDFIFSALKELIGDEKVEIVSGHCEGVDKTGERYAIENGHDLKIFEADWKKHGRAAGPIRNEAMAVYANEAIIFSGKTKGSADMLKRAKKYGLKITVVDI